MAEFAGPVVVIDPGNFSPQYTANLCSSLAEQGLDVTLVTSPPQFGIMPASRGYRVENCFFSYIADAGFLHSRTAHNARARMVVKACAYPSGLARTKRLLSSKSPGILHYQWTLLPILDAGLVSALHARGWRVAVTAHDLSVAQPFSSMWKWQAVRFYRVVDAVVVHTARLAEEAQRDLHIAPSKLNVIERGDLGVLRGPLLSREEARARIGIDGAGPVLLFFGMIKPNKGLDHLLYAMPAVLKSNPEARLVIAGEPVEKFERYAAIITQQGIERAVLTRLGYVRDEDVGSYFQSANLVVLPHTHISLSGVASVALGFGCPIVGTNIGGLPDLVGDGSAGFLVPPGSPVALSEAINRALADPEQLRRRGEQGRARFEAGHSWARTASETLQLYRKLMKA